MLSREKTEHRIVFRMKEMDAKNKDRLFYKITQGSELVEVDEALFHYCANVFRDFVLAELSDRFIVELYRSEKSGLHLIEFFKEKSTEGIKFWIKPADCILETPVDGLPHFQRRRFRLRSEIKSAIKTATILNTSMGLSGDEDASF